MSQPELPEKVLIIGAGPGGLALAQILRQNNVPFGIFERTAEYAGKKQGWTVGLIESLPLVRNLLPADLGDIRRTSVNHEVGEHDIVGILDGKTGLLKASVGGAGADGKDTYYLRANRERLREFLSKNIHISMGKQFLRSSQDDGGITAHFSDGSSYRGQLLVGADGSFSAVRGQLLGKYQGPSLSPDIPMNGVCELSRAEYEPLRKVSNAFLIAALDGIFFTVGLISIKPDQSSAVYYWGVAFLAGDPQQSSQWVQNADSTTLYNKCIELTKHMPDWLTNIIQKTGPDGMVDPQIRFYEYILPDDVPTDKRIVLMGDAAHTMIPFKGAGANTAITDACELGQAIVKGMGDSGSGQLTDLEGMIQEYNQVMIPRGREIVLQSRAAGQSDKGISAITEGRIHTLNQ